MAEIIPAILPKNYEDMKNKIALVRDVAQMVQIDICDGNFVKSTTWPFSTGGASDYNFQKILNEHEGMPFWEDVDFELDLMVSDAVTNFDIYTKLSPKRIVFHIEAVGNIADFKEFVEGIDVYIRDSIEIGVALNTTTDTASIFPLINSIDFVQVMGIEHIGLQGQDFDERSVEVIKTLKNEFPDLVISVDGAVSIETAPLLIDAGASRLVIGSSIFNSTDIIGKTEEFNQL